MAFNDYEASNASGSKVELFKIVRGGTEYYLHNASEAVWAYAGHDYEKTAIQRDSIAQDTKSLVVTMPASHPFPAMFVSLSPSERAFLYIYALHRPDPTSVQLVYTGEIRSVEFTDNMFVARLSVTAISCAFSKEIPNWTYQPSCNRLLGETSCGVDLDAMKFTGTVDAIFGSIVTISGLETAKGDGWATGGYIAVGDYDRRLILLQDGDDLTISVPFYSDVTSEVCYVYPGCDRSLATCDTKFSNSINFLGCPYVPGTNPFEGTL